MVLEVVLPGDEIPIASKEGDPKRILGPGLRYRGDKVISTKAGELKERSPNYLWVEGTQKRYVPVKSEEVIGIVTTKGVDAVRVDIGASSIAILNLLAFEGVTKRNKPNLQVGDIVYARLLEANRDMEPELVCIDGKGKSSGLGQLTDGFMINCSVDYCRSLLSKENKTLSILAEFMAFEVAIGLNGRIWLNSSSVQNIVILSNAIQMAARTKPENLKSMLQKLLNVKRK